MVNKQEEVTEAAVESGRRKGEKRGGKERQERDSRTVRRRENRAVL